MHIALTAASDLNLAASKWVIWPMTSGWCCCQQRLPSAAAAAAAGAAAAAAANDDDQERDSLVAADGTWCPWCHMTATRLRNCRAYLDQLTKEAIKGSRVNSYTVMLRPVACLLLLTCVPLACFSARLWCSMFCSWACTPPKSQPCVLGVYAIEHSVFCSPRKCGGWCKQMPSYLGLISCKSRCNPGRWFDPLQDQVNARSQVWALASQDQVHARSQVWALASQDQVHARSQVWALAVRIRCMLDLRSGRLRVRIRCTLDLRSKHCKSG